MGKDRQIQKVSKLSLEKLSEDSKLVKRGLRDLNVWSKPKILIFEDDQFITELLISKFRAIGFEIKSFQNYENVINIVAEEKPNIVYCDIVVPGEMDGWDAIKLLRKDERTKNIPIIIVSNLCRKEDVKKGLDLGANYHCCTAEYTPNQLIDVFKNHLIKTGKFNKKDFNCK